LRLTTRIFDSKKQNNGGHVGERSKKVQKTWSLGRNGGVKGKPKKTHNTREDGQVP